MDSTRRPWAWLAALSLIVVLLVVGIAAVLRGADSADGPAGSPSPSAAVDETPTLGSTPEPTIEPTTVSTPGGTAEPTAPPAGRTSLAAFARHVRRAVEDGAALLESLREAAQAFDIPTVRDDAHGLAAWATDESAWLRKHPPEACYGDAHAGYASAIEDFAEAAAITERFATDFPLADFDALQQALDLANSGSASMQAASDLLKAVRC
jgi:hypothetical protein